MIWLGSEINLKVVNFAIQNKWQWWRRTCAQLWHNIEGPSARNDSEMFKRMGLGPAWSMTDKPEEREKKNHTLEPSRSVEYVTVCTMICISCRQDHKPINVLTWLIPFTQFFFSRHLKHTLWATVLFLFSSCHCSVYYVHANWNSLPIRLNRFLRLVCVAFVWTSRTDSTLTVLLALFHSSALTFFRVDFFRFSIRSAHYNFFLLVLLLCSRKCSSFFLMCV